MKQGCCNNLVVGVKKWMVSAKGHPFKIRKKVEETIEVTEVFIPNQ